jgi:hypothetical protein
MVVVTAFVCENAETSVDFLPVVAPETRVIHECSKNLPTGRHASTPPDHRDLIEDGWHFDWQTNERDVLVIDAETGVMPAEDLFGDVSNLTYQVVAAPWPEPEDKEPPRSTGETLRAEVLEKTSRTTSENRTNTAWKAVGSAVG